MKKKNFKKTEEKEVNNAKTKEMKILFDLVRPANSLLELYLGAKKIRDAAQELKLTVHSDVRVNNSWRPNFEIRRCDVRTLRALEKFLKQNNFKGGHCPNILISGAGGDLWVAQQMRNLLASVPFVSLMHNYVVLESAGTTFWYDKRLARWWREKYALLALHSIGNGLNSDYPFHDRNIDLAMARRPKGAFYEIVLSRKDNDIDSFLYRDLFCIKEIPVRLFSQKRNAWATSLISAVDIWNYGPDTHEFFSLNIEDLDSWLEEEKMEFEREIDPEKRFYELLDWAYLLMFSDNYSKFLSGLCSLIHVLYKQAPEFLPLDKELCNFYASRWVKNQNQRGRYVAPVFIHELASSLRDLHSLFDCGREGDLWFDEEEPDWKTIVQDWHQKWLNAKKNQYQ